MLNQPINLLTKQTQAWDHLETGPVVDLGYGGGAGGGKTDLGVKLALFIASQFPGSVGAIGRNTLVDLKKTVLVSLFEYFALQGITAKDYRYDEKYSLIEFTNTSIIYLLELKNRPRDPLYTNLGSLQLSWGWIEEANEVPFRAVDILSTRVGRANYKPEWEENLKQFFGVYDERLGKIILKPFILQTFNPGKGHVYNKFWKPFKKGLLPPDRQFIRALPTDNPYLSSAYMRNLEKADKPTKERLLYGNFDFDDDPQKIFIYDKITDLFTNKHVKLEGEKYMVIDPSGKGKDKTVVSIWHGWRAYKWYEEQVTDQSILIPKLRKFQEEEGIPNSNTICDYDGLGVGIVDQMRCKAFQGGTSPIASEEEKEQEIVPNYKNLRSQCYFLIAEKVNKNEVMIEMEDSEKREYITEELDVIKEINDGKDQKKQIIPKGSVSDEPGTQSIKSLLSRSPDYADNIMMRSWFELGKEAPFFFSVT